MISMKRLLVCFVLILSFVCVPIGSQTSYSATKTKAQSKYVSNKVLKKWKKGWHSRAGRKYYCVKKGKLAKGWKKIGKNKYYFDKKNGFMLRFRQTIRGKKYYFNSKGAMKTGLVKFKAGNRWYDKNGKQVTGWKTVPIKGKKEKHCFDPKTGIMIPGNTDEALEIPVLTFHRIVSDKVKRTTYPDDQWVASVEDFKEQMQYLYEHDYKALSMDEYYDWYKGKRTLKKKSIVLTIDDGDYELYYLVAPVLKKYGFKATAFVVESRIKPVTPFYSDEAARHYMGADLIEKIHSEYPNLLIQSHTYDLHHYENDRMAVFEKSYEELREDFAKTNPEYRYMAWPYGYFSDEAVTAFKGSHYRLGFNFGRYRNSTRADLPWSVYRVKINGQMKMDVFKKTVEIQ